LLEIGQIDPITKHDATLHLNRGGYEFAFHFREMLVDGQMMVNACNRHTSLEDDALAERLLNQALHKGCVRPFRNHRLSSRCDYARVELSFSW